MCPAPSLPLIIILRAEKFPTIISRGEGNTKGPRQAAEMSFGLKRGKTDGCDQGPTGRGFQLRDGSGSGIGKNFGFGFGYGSGSGIGTIFLINRVLWGI